MAFAARHLHALGVLPARNNAEEAIAALEDCSMSSLRQQLTEPSYDQHAVALATTRTLCQAQIFAASHSWRTHLEGARAILQAASCPHARVTDTTVANGRSASIHDFLASWYNNVEALVALTPLGLHRGQLEMASSGLRNGKVYFDVFGGVASDLPDLFREVGALVIERRRRFKCQERNENNVDSILTDDDIAIEAEALVHEIHVRLKRDAVGRLCLDGEQALSLSHDIMHDYALSNAGFLHTALLYIHGAVQCLPMWAPEVRHSVQQIIHCSESMKSASALSPRVLMATPLFTAGLWALPDARVAIKKAFEIMSTWMRMPHITRSSALLEYVWSKTSVSQQHDVLTYLEESPEFLPY
ncbi:c6 zinc finger domain containing protein [Grosmannia clavigera kw1407]|uniref:C6 zinc finger domain containing protein n=1 Tax=Grosmannia clavigera (strain kw1407 / UAMH 11150) TaxID=655863 RepID=F0X9S4_GROCL|nr:c6 zinc finger domain containing protein [Grosmannia clavigera kw1407]EFX06124.1 c6 zinc finger domain containing protein [Grosmannia clavigera kw1407]